MLTFMNQFPAQLIQMTLRHYLFAFFAALFALLAMDALWLGVLMTSTYQSYLGALLLDEPRLLPTALFYALYPAGLVVFAVTPAFHKRDWRSAAVLGGLLGLVAYGTYNLSNLATLTLWPWQLTVIDMAWGMFLSSAAATAGYGAARR